MEIRALTSDLYPAVNAIYLEGIATGHATFQTEGKSWQEWDAGHLQPCRLVALEGETVVGWAALSPVSSRCVYAGVAEVSVYVSEAARGKGIGKALLQRLVPESEAAGIWTLQAGIFPENAASLALHQQAGFRIVGRRERIGRMQTGEWRDAVLLERRSNTIGTDNKRKIVLVLCTGNSCRSQIAEGYLRQLAGDKAVIYSAGVETHGVNPRAIATMAEDGIDISRHTSNNIAEYRDLDFDHVITVCDNARERCPFFPSKAQRLHQNFPDPAKATGSEHEIMAAFRAVREEIKAYVRQFVQQHLAPYHD